jgi:hypothetical protein
MMRVRFPSAPPDKYWKVARCRDSLSDYLSDHGFPGRAFLLPPMASSYASSLASIAHRGKTNDDTAPRHLARGGDAGTRHGRRDRACFGHAPARPHVVHLRQLRSPARRLPAPSVMKPPQSVPHERTLTAALPSLIRILWIAIEGDRSHGRGPLVDEDLSVEDALTTRLVALDSRTEISGHTREFASFCNARSN